MLEFLQYEAVATTVIVLMALCTLIILIGNAANVIKQIFQPKNVIESRLNNVEQRLDHVDACLKNDKVNIEGIICDGKLMLRAVCQLITHEIDGNHVGKLCEIRDEIEEYLIEK